MNINLTYLDFANHLNDSIGTVVTEGDILTVSYRNGNFVVLEEAEYKALRDAAALLMKNGKK